MANGERKKLIKEEEILRLSVRKKNPDASEYEYEMCYDTEDEHAIRLSEIIETALENEINLSFLIKVLEKAIEAGVDLSDIMEEENE